MRYRSAEDRLNPIAPEGATDTTLGGYPAVHGRAPALEGSDGEPYTAGPEVEPADDGDGWVGYIVFVRWAQTGSAIMGHLDSADLVRAATEEGARELLDAIPLARVKEILDETIEMKRRAPEW